MSKTLNPSAGLWCWLLAVGVFLGGCVRQPQPGSFAQVKGQVALSGQEEHEGVRVYLPGSARVAYSDRAGRFVLDQLPPGEAELVVAAEGYLPVRMLVNLKAGAVWEPTQTIVLEPVGAQPRLGAIQGRILLEDTSENLAGTRVIVQGQELELSVKTDAQGRFSVAELPPGSYQVHPVRPGYVTGSREVTVREGEILELEDLVLSSGGLAVARATSAGLLRGRAQLKGQNDHSGILVSVEGTSSVATTDEAGRFALSTVGPEPFDLAFLKAGYQTRKLKGVMLADATEVLDVALEPEVSLPSSGAVRGFVQFEGGFQSDLSGVEVVLAGNLNYRTTTETDGRYWIANVAPGYYRLRVTAEGFEELEVLGIQVEPNKTTDIAPVVLQELEGSVTAQPQDHLSGTALLFGKKNHEGTLAQLEGTNLVATTNPEGVYTFYGVPTGVYKISLHHSGYRSEQISDVQIVAGESLTLGPVTLYEERERPYVLYTEPANKSRGVEVKEFVEILVVFSTRMNGATVKRAVSIVPPVTYRLFFGGEHPRSDNDRLVIRMIKDANPTIRLNTEYKITLAPSVQDILGVPMEVPYEFAFETGGPRVVRTYPQDGDEDVFFTIRDYLMFDFNSPVNYDSIQKALKITPAPDSQPMLFPEKVPVGARVKFEVDFKFNTRYTVTLTTQARTADGKRFENTPYSFSFRTGDIQQQDDAIDDLFLPR